MRNPLTDPFGVLLPYAAVSVCFIGPMVALGCILVNHPLALQAIERRNEARREAFNH